MTNMTYFPESRSRMSDRLDRLERAVLLLADATNRLAAAISNGELGPLDRSEVLYCGRIPWKWDAIPSHIIEDIASEVEEDERTWMVRNFLIREEKEE